jgi:dephospho-CoA kinase
MPETLKPRRPSARDGLLIVGLVGRAGSGKSSVARAMAARGAVVIDADAIGHEVTDRDPEVRAALLAEYGPAVYLDDGTLNRRLVAAKVFANAAALAALNRLVHPRIIQRVRARIAALTAEGRRGPVVVDAALMLDWGFENQCDGIVAVTAPEAVQVGRLVAARGWSEAEARRRLAAQKPNEHFAAAADIVIENAGSPAELDDAAARALEQLARARGGQA